MILKTREKRIPPLIAEALTKEMVGPGRFVSEPISPVTATSDTSRMAIGEPGLPRQFIWRGRTIEIVTVLRSWRQTGKCRHGSPELYMRKHWYEVETMADGIMTIYFDRQPRHGRKEGRWWLFSVKNAESPQEGSR